MAVKEKIANYASNAAAGCLFALVALPALLILFHESNGPRVRTFSFIPKTTRGKIGFLEEQFNRAAQAESCRRAWTYEMAQPLAPGRLRSEAFEDLEAKERKIVDKLILLYQSVGEYEKASKLQKTFIERVQTRRSYDG